MTPIYPINNSLRQAYKSCPRKLFWISVAGLDTRRKGSALIMGSAFHKGLEHWRLHGGKHPAAAIKEAENLLKAEMADNFVPRETQAFEMAKLEAYLLGYFQTYAGDFTAGDWHTEVKIETPTEYGTLDAMYEDHEGVWIVDDKTRSELSPDQPAALAMEEQLLTYILLAQGRDWNVAGAVWRETLKTACRPRTKETPEEFGARLRADYCGPTGSRFYRETKIKYSDDQLSNFLLDKQDLDHRLREDLDRATAGIENLSFNGGNCIGPYGPCGYLKLCTNDSQCATYYKPSERIPLDGSKFQDSLWPKQTPSPRLPSGRDATAADGCRLPASPGGQQAAEDDGC